VINKIFLLRFLRVLRALQ